jgi:hypothetical protein
MSDIKRINHPLIRELQELGILSTDATPVFIGDVGSASVIAGSINGATIRTNTEAFDGDASGAYEKLAQDATGVVSLFAYDGTAIAAMTPTTNYVLDGTAFTFKSSFTGKRIVLTYTY